MKKYLLILVYIAGLLVANSQELPTKTNEVDEMLDELLMEESFNDIVASLANLQFLYVSVNFNTNTYFSGRDINVDQFNLTPQITYMHSKGFYASVSGIMYSKFIPNWDVTIATAGFGKNFGKNKIFRYNGSLSAYLYANNNVDDLYNSAASISLGVQNKNRSLGTQVASSYYFGGEPTYQVISKSYANINLFKNNNQNLKFRPQLNFILGTQLIDIDGITAQNNLLDYETETENTQLTSNVFALIYTQLNFILQYNIKSFDFEVGYNLNIPSELEYETNLTNTNYFNFGISYLIDL